jgi:hypothetical protein
VEGLVVEHGARFIIGAPHPTFNAEAFVQSAGQNPAVRRALAGTRYRLLHLLTDDELDKDGDRDHCRECVAVYYDYTHNRTVRIRGGASGSPQIEYSQAQPPPSEEEFDAAVALIRQSAAWGPLLKDGHVRPYRPMQPTLEATEGHPVERTLYVGLISKPRRFNRIVAVNMIRQEVSPEPARPRGVVVSEMICGPEAEPCIKPRRGTRGTVVIEWPAADPVWRFQAIRPASSSGTNGSGIELRNVTYKGKRVLKQAHVPILNVNYDDDVCGPFRDWLYEEMCFQAIGPDVQGAPGFRWCTEPPQTITESGVDGGNFTGVAVYDDVADGSLQLVTQCWAGWYRYVHEWRFYPDGTLVPRFRFGGINNSCVCNVHHHHAYWRFDFDIIDKNNRLQEFVAGEWQTITKETSRLRQPKTETRWRVLHKSKEIGYEIVPGERDDYGDDFSGDDQYALRYRKKELDDGPLHDHETHLLDGAQADFQQFLRKPESLKKQDVVVWYAAHFRHHMDDEDEHPHEVGPRLVPINWPEPRKRR